jgi:exodeoxyribonuclease VIII
MEKISGISNYEYHYGKYKDYVSSTGLKNILVSPEYYKQKQLSSEPTSSMNLGTAVHTLLLEPEKYHSSICVMPKFSGTGSVKAKKDFLVSIDTNTTIISEEQSLIVDSIKSKFQKNDELINILSGGESEVSIFFEHGGTKYKVRPDYLKQDLIIDLKTTSKPLCDFPKECANYKYDLSAWFYCFGAEIPNYKFLVVETNPPYNFVLFEPDSEFMEEGKRKALIAMDILSECLKYNIWPGVELHQKLSLPRWYIGA